MTRGWWVAPVAAGLTIVGAVAAGWASIGWWTP